MTASHRAIREAEWQFIERLAGMNERLAGETREDGWKRPIEV